MSEPDAAGAERVPRDRAGARLTGRRAAGLKQGRAGSVEEERLARYSVEAMRSAADLLGVSPLTLAERLREGEIARLMRLLNAARADVSSAGLRHRIEDLLSAATDGQMPMFERPETEFDWAMETLRRRRERAPDGGEAATDEPGA